MMNLALGIVKKSRHPRKIFVEVDAYRLERLADALGFYNPDFLHSLGRAEQDIRFGRVKRLRTAKDLT